MSLKKEKGPTATLSTVQSESNNTSIILSSSLESNPAGQNSAELYPSPYSVDNGSLYIEVQSRNGSFLRKLCNFAPYLAGEQIIDDGSQETRFLEVNALHENGTYLRQVKINAKEFASMNWICDCWGAQCNVAPLRSAKEHIRYALQCTTNGKTNVTYTHLGWRKIENKWHYLMPGNGFDVQLQGKLRNYHLSQGDCNAAVNESLNCIMHYPIPQPVSFPLFAYTYLSPLNSFLKLSGYEPKFILALVGKTGSKKSSVAALFLSHFGSFTNTSLPMSFRDTAYSIVQNSFSTKDALTVVDDFHPSTKQEEMQMTSIAQILVRAYGDRAGRNKLRSDSSMMCSRPPQGNCLITCEQMPDISESGHARCLRLDLSDKEVKLDSLTTLQNHARNGLFQVSMQCYIDWIGNQLEQDEMRFVESLRKLFESYREHFTQVLRVKAQNYHDRTPENVAWLSVGIELFQRFVVSKRILQPKESTMLTGIATPIFEDLAARQCLLQVEDNPVDKFLSKFQSLIVSGRLHVQPLINIQPVINPGFVGYVDDSYYYLITDIVHSAVKKLCEDQGEHFSMSAQTLLKRLDEDGYLQVGNTKRTRQLKVNGQPKWLMWLRKERLLL